MIRAIIIALSVMFSLNAPCNEELQGKWQANNIRITFDGDSLFIDDIGNEGDAFSFRTVIDQILTTDGLGYNDTIYYRIKNDFLYIRYNHSKKTYKFKKIAP